MPPQKIKCAGPGCDVDFVPHQQFHNDCCRAKAHKLVKKNRKRRRKQPA